MKELPEDIEFTHNLGLWRRLKVLWTGRIEVSVNYRRMPEDPRWVLRETGIA